MSRKTEDKQILRFHGKPGQVAQDDSNKWMSGERNHSLFHGRRYAECCACFEVQVPRRYAPFDKLRASARDDINDSD